MRGTYRLLLLASSLAVFASAGTAFAMPKCTTHDLLIQKINTAYQTQFHTNCAAPRATRQAVR